MDYEELYWEADDSIRQLEDMFDFYYGEVPKDVQHLVSVIQNKIRLLKIEIKDLDIAISEQTSQE